MSCGWSRGVRGGRETEEGMATGYGNLVWGFRTLLKIYLNNEAQFLLIPCWQ